MTAPPVIATDSSALVAILRREAEADRFLQAIAAADGRLLSSVSLLEASTVLAGRTGDASAWAELDALTARAGVQVVAQDAALTEAARQAFLRHGRGRHPASPNSGDCASYALAKIPGVPLLFKGSDFPRTDLAPAA